MFTIQNDLLSVSINERGAELNSIFHKGTNLEYLWNADPAFWAKKSPVLFPIVGTLKDNVFVDPLISRNGSRPYPYYLPTAKSPLIDRGLKLNYPFEGAAPDIGAYEMK